MDRIVEILNDVRIPRFARVGQEFDPVSIDDIEAAVDDAFVRSGVLSRVRAGSRIAIAVGSRGVANVGAIVKATVDGVRSRGASPFVVPAMGSHGGATAEGQTKLLEHLGVSELTVGAPIRATMEVVEGRASASGLTLWTDRYARESDGIIVVNRIKPHTSFSGPVESGLMKMVVIGLGKQRGAEAAHGRGFGYMSETLSELYAVASRELPLLFGIGSVESAYGQTARLEVVLPEQFPEVESRLLAEARTHMPRIMLSPLDVLIVDEIGKNISGLGMDPHVTGRSPNEYVEPGTKVGKIVVLRLSSGSEGNQAGIGFSDVTTARLERSTDRRKGYINSLTSTSAASIRMPMVMATDELAIKAALRMSNAADPDSPRVVRISNTLRLDQILVSEALLEEARRHERTRVLSAPEPLDFDGEGNLPLLTGASAKG